MPVSATAGKGLNNRLLSLVQRDYRLRSRTSTLDTLEKEGNLEEYLRKRIYFENYTILKFL